MNSRNIIIGIIVLAVIVIGGVWLYDWVLGETEEASGPIQPTPVVIDTPVDEVIVTSTPETLESPESSEPTQAAQDEQGLDAALAGIQVYQISQDESSVSFTIYEELRGSPKDVIGVSNQVAGEVAVDLSDLSTAQVGVIQINARTFTTDDDRRNQAIRNRILFTDQYEFITFTPTQITGLSGRASPGQPFNFQITGDLTIIGNTQPVVFNVSGQVESPDRLTGMATTTIQRSDFNIVVPSVPFVANPGEEVTLEISLVLVPT